MVLNTRAIPPILFGQALDPFSDSRVGELNHIFSSAESATGREGGINCPSFPCFVEVSA
jgi:hypothetical protein